MNKLKTTNKKSILSYFTKVANSFKGLYTALKEEGSLIFIFFIIGSSYLVGGILYEKMTLTEWIIIVLVGTLLLAVEIINTAIENIVDLINFKYGINARKIKNISSAASLIMNLGSIIAFCILFIPKVIQ